jgi:hypothetical protein
MNLVVRTNIQYVTACPLQKQKRGVRKTQTLDKVSTDLLSREVFVYYRYIQKEKTDASTARSQVTTSEVACY